MTKDEMIVRLVDRECKRLNKLLSGDMSGFTKTLIARLHEDLALCEQIRTEMRQSINQGARP